MSQPPAPIIRLDLRGLHCPLPVLRARKALRHVPIGQAVRLECTDPLASIDIPHFVREAGHTLIDQHQEAEVLIFVIVRRC